MSKKEKSSSLKGRWRLKKKKPKDPSDDVELEISDLKELLELREINLKPRVNVSKSSKLSPSLLDILKKSVALGYFLDFLKERDERNLLDFWLEAETFRMISESKYRRRKPRSGSSISRKSSVSGSPALSRTPSYCAVSNKDSNKNETCRNDELNDTLTSNDDTWNCSCSEDGDSLPDFTAVPSKNTYQPCLSENTVRTISVNSMHPSNHEWSEQTDDSDFAKLNSCSRTNSAPNFKTSIKASTLPKVTKSSTSLDGFRQRARTRSAIVDAVTIYSKYISLNAESPIFLPTPKRQEIEAIICKDKNAIDADCFVVAQEYCFEKLSSLHREFLHTINMIMYQLKILDENQIRLQDVLYNGTIFFYFMEFLDQSGCKAVLEFYMAAESFEEDIEIQHLNDEYELETAVNDAMYLYERYFSMRCEKQLIQDDKLRIVLENNICREDGPQPNCFCIPMAYAWTVLAEVYLPMFLSSEVYQSYLEHLRKTVQNKEDLKSCSSRSSLSVDDNLPLLVHSDSKLNLFDDKGIDEFWFKPQQQNSSRLTLGHMNEFGVFSSEMEPEPFSGKETDSSVSKLGKAMKNLLRGETQQETEQLAWERARKIISDIQKETQNS